MDKCTGSKTSSTLNSEPSVTCRTVGTILNPLAGERYFEDDVPLTKKETGWVNPTLDPRRWNNDFEPLVASSLLIEINPEPTSCEEWDTSDIAFRNPTAQPTNQLKPEQSCQQDLPMLEIFRSR